MNLQEIEPEGTVFIEMSNDGKLLKRCCLKCGYMMTRNTRDSDIPLYCGKCHFHSNVDSDHPSYSPLPPSAAFDLMEEKLKI